jgi:hypothetical protein
MAEEPAPTVVEEIRQPSPDFPFVGASHVVVDSHGRVYVEWERLPTGFAGDMRELRIASSSNQGSSFGPSSKIDNTFAVGDGYAMRGAFRDWITGSLSSTIFTAAGGRASWQRRLPGRMIDSAHGHAIYR